MGVPMDLADPKGVRVLALWATWCAPCRFAVPRLTALQRQYDGLVTVVGVTEEEFGNTLGSVRASCRESAEDIGYHIAWAAPSSLVDLYQGPTGMSGLPLYVVINLRGRIAWLSHDVVELPDVVGRVIAGDWDMEARGAWALSALRLRRHVRLVARERGEAVKRGDSAAALEALEYLIASGSANPHVAARGEKLRLLIQGAGSRGESLAFAEATLADSAAACSPAVLARMSRLLLTLEPLDAETVDLARELALEAERVDEDVSAWVASTVAMIRFEEGLDAESIRLQTWARDAASDQSTRRQLQAALEELQRKSAHRRAHASGSIREMKTGAAASRRDEAATRAP